MDSVTNDRTADWQAYALPLNAEGKFEAPNAAPANCYMVVSSKCENIDAVMRYFNVATNQNDLLEQNLYKDMEGLGEAYRLSAITLVTDYVDCIPKKNVLYLSLIHILPKRKGAVSVMAPSGAWVSRISHIHFSRKAARSK